MVDEASTAPDDDLVSALAEYVNADAPDAGDEYIAACAMEASTLVDNYVGKVKLPAEIRTRAILEVGADLFHRRASRNGVIGFEGVEAIPVRIARDPMLSAYPILRQYLPIGLA